MVYVIRSEDRESFKRCRRAWDFGSRARQNYEPSMPARVFDFERAIHDALAIYYFPGMWEWERAIVLPLALEGFLKSMHKQRAAHVEAQALCADEEKQWNEYLQLGEAMLKRYFDWAPRVDRFCPIRIETEFDVNIPDPSCVDRDLALPAGVPIRYRGRVDLLVVDANDAYWLVDHRTVLGLWEDIEELVLDERGVSYGWAWENFFLGMRVAGTLYNELRIDTAERPTAPAQARVGEPQGFEQEPAAQHRRMYAHAKQGRSPELNTQSNDYFRRTQIPRSRAELANAGKQLALEALDMTNPELSLYPNPSRENCGHCPYRKPCIAINDGSVPGPILKSWYRKRGDEQIEQGRLGGSTWSIDRGAMPPKFGPKMPSRH